MLKLHRVIWNRFCSNQLQKQVENQNQLKFLKIPKTSFDSRLHPNLTEPLLLEQVGRELYNSQEQLQLQKDFVLHEPPISLHENLHIGHFYNKTLKDIICRYKLLRGYHVHSTPGFESYGPQIEHAALTHFHQQQNNLKPIEYDPQLIRKICLEYSQNQLKQYIMQIHRWGIMTDLNNSYVTSQSGYGLAVLKMFDTLIQEDKLIEKYKPILWSSRRLCQIDLDQVSIEYVEKTGYFYKIEINNDQLDEQDSDLKDMKLLTFTTEPWMLTAVNSIGINPDIDYILYRTDKNERLVMSKAFSRKHKSFIKSQDYYQVGFIQGQQLEDAIFKHPLTGINIPVILNNEISIENGSGVLSLCPAHSLDDLEIVNTAQRDLSKKCYLNEDFTLNNEIGKDLSGLQVLNGEANIEILRQLRLSDSILDIQESISTAVYTHKQTKETILLRTVKNIFTSVDETDIEMYLEQAQPKCRNYQEEKHQIYASFEEMLAAKGPEYCISSRNVWGIPLPVCYITDVEKFNQIIKQNKIRGIKPFKKGEIEPVFLNSDFVQHMMQLFTENGYDIWWNWQVSDLLPNNLKPLQEVLFRKFDLVFDPVFSSGVSWVVDLLSKDTEKKVGILKTDQIQNRSLQLYPCDLVFEGKDSNESWMTSSALLSILTTGKPFFKQIITHPLIASASAQDTKISKFSNDLVSLEDLIEGPEKFNSQRQHGHGVDILRAFVCSITKNVDETLVQMQENYLQYRTQEIALIRQCYFKLLSSLNQYSYQDNFRMDQLSFVICFFFNKGQINKFIFYNLIFYVVNITAAYEQLEFQKIYDLYIDFMKYYVLDIFVDGTRNYITSFYNTTKAQESLYFYKKIMFETLVTISPVLPFNTENMLNHIADNPQIKQAFRQWPRFVIKFKQNFFKKTQHIEDAKENIIKYNILFKIRRQVHEEINASQERIFQKGINKQIHLVFMIDNPLSIEQELIDLLEDDGELFFNVGRVTVENDLINKNRKSSSALASFKVILNIEEFNINIKVKCYKIKEEECPRCLEHSKNKDQEVCNKCFGYVSEMQKLIDQEKVKIG